MGRLIDADALKKYLRDYKWEFAMGSDFSKAMEMIDEQPTAYDVEKVVAELEQREEACIECYVEAMTEGNGGSASSFCGERWAYNNAIDIVKAGGVE